jgi:RimJ/RimL family protein N-acetyltransferase
MTAQLVTRSGVAAHVALRDGSAVRIGPISGADAERLVDGFSRLSAKSREFRFLGGKSRLSSTELRYLTEIDHHDHEALIAVSLLDGRGVGVARYVRATDNPEVAEVAITVVDEWHGRGLGTELLTRLIDRAVDEGITRFSALVSADNVAVLRLLRNISVDYHLVGLEHGVVEYEIMLPAPQNDAA